MSRGNSLFLFVFAWFHVASFVHKCVYQSIFSAISAIACKKQTTATTALLENWNQSWVSLARCNMNLKTDVIISWKLKLRLLSMQVSFALFPTGFYTNFEVHTKRQSNNFLLFLNEYTINRIPTNREQTLLLLLSLKCCFLCLKITRDRRDFLQYTSCLRKIN